MLSRPTRWACEPYDVGLAERLAAGLGVSRPVGVVLARRGFESVEAARQFLAADERHDPLTLPGVSAAVELIREHLRRGSRIAVFGDYDVDGVCSTAILLRTLRSLGADPLWELPSRFDEGYGLSTAAVERLAGRGVGLLVTVDCGITAVEQVAAARAAGLDVIVSDHHRPGEELPECVLVHPALDVADAEPYGTPELCAAGVALKLCEALGAAEEEHIDLAALATVCDLVPLRGENRRIVREGIVAMARTDKPGLRALMGVAAVEPAELTEHSLGFRLGPRINAAGRMRRADAALELLLTEDGARAAEVARELDLLNADRQQAEQRILSAAEAGAAAQASQAAIVVAGEDWHPGVVGIVASRLVERWRRPCVAIALDGDGGGRGSGRSIGPYDLHAGLAACAAHLTRFGGHRMAAGVELAAESVDPFRRALAAHAGAALTPADLIPVERVDAVVPGGVLGLDLADQLETLRPFGMGNPQPTLLVPAARFQNVTAMGEEREHSRFTLVTAGGARSRGVAFRSPPSQLAPAADTNHDIALRLERNRWNGVVEPRTILRALCPTRPGTLKVLGEEGSFWERIARAREPGPVPAGTGREPVDRRREGFAGVAGDLFSSGERVLVVVADVERRRRGLEEIVAGLACSRGRGDAEPGAPERATDGIAVATWAALAADPRLATAHDHLVALDPPPGGSADPLLRAGAEAHMAWGPAEAEFALQVWRAELDLRPALADAYLRLRELPPAAAPDAIQTALEGAGRYPRSSQSCARIVEVLRELGLIELALEPPSLRLLEAQRTDLERSPTYRACADRLAAIERALAPELPRRESAQAA